MATRKHNNVLRFPRRRSYQQLIAQIEIQQLLIDVLCYAQPNPVHMLTQAQRRQLSSVSRRTGLKQQDMVKRAVGNWLNDEAPVYVQHYDA